MSKRTASSPRLPSIGSFSQLDQLSGPSTSRTTRRSWLSLLWSSNRRTGGHHLHSDPIDDPDDIKNQTIHERWDEAEEEDGLFKTPFKSVDRMVSRLDKQRKSLAISRKGALVVFVLLLLGLYESTSSSALMSNRSLGGLRSNRGKRGNEIVKVKGRDPFDVLEEIEGFSSLIPPPSHRFLASINARRRKLLRRPSSGLVEPPATSFHETQQHIWRSSPDSSEGDARNVKGEGDTTAIVLNWKRTENVVVIVASLCQYSFFQTVLVWNNNPDVFLTRDMFHSSRCSPSKLRIYNSPTNLYFLSRYLACSTASTPYCFFQDDDWLVKPIRSMYSVFKRDPEAGVVVSTDSKVSVLFGWEWCFFNGPMHSCFAWVGTGAFTAKSHVLHFLSTSSSSSSTPPSSPSYSDSGLLYSLHDNSSISPPYTSQELAHADNSFTTLLNKPPYVLSSSRLDQLPSKFGHSDGEGIERNKRFIHLGIQRLISLLTASLPSASSVPFLSTPATRPSLPALNSLAAPHRLTPPPPLALHPFSHHSRSPRATSDDGVFITNVELLPMPESVLYPVIPATSSSSSPTKSSSGLMKSLSQWENKLGWVGRGWLEGLTEEEKASGEEEGELFKEGETWALKWGYGNAVDGDAETAFRSRDVIETGDYIGLGLLEAIDPDWINTVRLDVILESWDTILPNLLVEVSGNGHHWYSPESDALTDLAPSPLCRPTSIRSSLPDESFPLTFLSSPLSVKIVKAQQLALQTDNIITTWWKRRRRISSEKLKICTWSLSTRLIDGSGKNGFKGESGEGWKFVRVRSRKGMEVGWGVYEIDLS